MTEKNSHMLLYQSSLMTPRGTKPGQYLVATVQLLVRIYAYGKENKCRQSWISALNSC